jgi:hypothetical protein
MGSPRALRRCWGWNSDSIGEAAFAAEEHRVRHAACEGRAELLRVPSPRLDGERVRVRGVGDWPQATLQGRPPLKRSEDSFQDAVDVAIDLVVVESSDPIA